LKIRGTKAILIVFAATVVAGWGAWRFSRGRGEGAGTGEGAQRVVGRYPPVAGIRNVVLISIDTCRADRLSCYGYPRPSTPNIDTVAREGVVFKKALAPVPMTLPSHSSLMTGTYPPVHGVRTNDGYRLSKANVTLAKVLRDAGYRTAAFVGGFPLDARFGLEQGFETYDGRFDNEGGKHDRRTADEVTGRGLAWLDARDKETEKRPFLLFLHYYDAHAPYHPPAPFDKQFADDPYAGGIAYVDSSIGRVLDRLRELGLYDNTLIIILGDHGESLGEHGERTHSFFVYQSTLHVPLVIRAPGLDPNGRMQHREVEQTVNLVDLMPTTLSLLGLAQPERVEGTDLRDSLEGKPLQEPPPGYFESLQPAVFDCCPLQGIVDGRWKYIRAPRSELYDLAADPSEKVNVAQKEADTAKRLRDRLEETLDKMQAVAAPGDSSLEDPAAAKRLESLGYVGGPVRRLDFDAAGEDPKDFAPVQEKIDEAHELNHAGRYEEANNKCREIVALRPQLACIHALLGDLVLRQGRPDEAVEWLSKALSILAKSGKKSKSLAAAVENHEIAAIRGQLGVALLTCGKTERAGVELRAALAIDADSADLQYDLGNVYKARGQFNDTVACYEKALQLKPRHVEAHYSLGTALAGCGRFDEALPHFREALEIDPGNIRAQVSLADALAGHGQPDDAIAHYREALKIQPDDVDALNNLGLALAGRGRVDEAIAYCRRALAIKPDYAPAHNNLGMALAGRGRFDEAIAHYEKAIQLKPDYAEAHNNLGVALAFGHGDMAAAIIHFQRALEIKPDYLGARQNLEHARSKQ
jgi:arylsulfatase A-like enzyme/Tfp pilus assembly protein PilF